MGVFAYYTEVRWLGVAAVIATILFFYALFRALLSLGTASAMAFSSTIILLIFGLSKYKFWLTARRLHPFDIYVYGSWENISYLKMLYPNHYHYIYASVGIAAFAAVALIYVEGLKRPRRAHFATAGIFASLFATFSWISPYLDGNGLGPANRFMHFDHQHVSTFFISVIKSIPELYSGTYFAYGTSSDTNASKVQLAQQNKCRPNNERQLPNVLTTMRESIMIPATMPAMAVPHVNETHFASSNGETYRLRVETFGGGSAHSILSLLSGLSADAFGAYKTLNVDLSRKHLHYSLAKQMAGCGYRTIAISAGAGGYVASKDFYIALGFDEAYDMVAVTSRNMADYSDRAIYKFLREKIAEAPHRPVFAYMDTTASHAPYTYPLRKSENIPEAANVTNPEISEYVRRIMLGERDLKTFLDTVATELKTGGRPMVVLDFGDHQPNLVVHLPGHPGYVVEDPHLDDPHLITYFRLQSVGYPLAFERLPTDHDLVDIAFLQDWLLRSLGWSFSGISEVRWQKIEKCKSRYWRCNSHESAQELHRVMRDAGLISFH